MKLLFLACALSLSVGVSDIAIASDLPSKKKAPASPSQATLLSSDWSGAYVGGSIGGANSSSDVVNDFGADFWSPTLTATSSGKMSEKTFALGVRAGQNWQNGSFVYGVEADLNYIGFSKSRTLNSAYRDYEPPLTYGMATKDRVSADFQATLRARAGIAVDRVLFYVTGGLAAANLNHSHNFSEYGSNREPYGTDWCEGNNGCDLNGGKENTLQFGWVIGGGAEWKIDDRFTLTAEYLHSQYNGSNGTTQWYNPAVPEWVPNAYVQHSANLSVDLFLVGLNYNF